MVECVAEVVDDLQQQFHASLEPDLYVEPQTPFEEF
jgi:hypothetical protein